MSRSVKDTVYKELLPVLPENIRVCLESIPEALWNEAYEIRLRVGQFPSLSLASGEYTLFEIFNSKPAVPRVSQEDISKALGLMSQNSIYAVHEEIKSGFITLLGGHRVGLAGKVICDSNSIQNIKYFSSLNIRIARQVLGAADVIIDNVIFRGVFLNTLIISPPRCGKTTVLRDMIRQLSNGIPRLNFKGVPIGVVDERSELAACYRGVPQNDVGSRTDVLDNCPKSEGIMMIVRALSPAVIATDEIGSVEDAKAIMTALSSGIGVVCTAHGSSIEDILLRPGLNHLVNANVFKKIVVLGSSIRPGTIERIYDGKDLKPAGQRQWTRKQQLVNGVG